MTFHEHDPDCPECEGTGRWLNEAPDCYVSCAMCGPTATLRIGSEQELREGLPDLWPTHWWPEGDCMTDLPLDQEHEYKGAIAITTRVLIIEPWEGNMNAGVWAELLATAGELDRIEIDCKNDECENGRVPDEWTEDGPRSAPCPCCHELREVLE